MKKKFFHKIYLKKNNIGILASADISISTKSYIAYRSQLKIKKAIKNNFKALKKAKLVLFPGRILSDIAM